MRADVLPEPELEFAGGARHIDPRYGLANYGPADLDSSGGPRAVRLGLIGDAASMDLLHGWLERCRDPIAAKDEKYAHLFPSFPGCDIDRGLHTAMVCSDRASNVISPRAIRDIEAATGLEAIERAVATYAEEARILAEQNRVDVIVLARPTELHDIGSRTPGKRARRATSKPTPSADKAATVDPAMRWANFHDLLKAELLNLGVPIQIIRRSTFDEATPAPKGRSRQDEATRAWNLHVALYYKAGGVPWRLVRDSRELMTLFVGVSFYQDTGAGTLETAVAQVFNERGDGVVVRGGAATTRSADRQPHLTEDAAHELMSSALQTYKREHKHLPARIVVHKASVFTDSEIAGFETAAGDNDIDSIDLTWVTESEGLRLFRDGNAPPLRGTHAELSPLTSALYTQGSVEFYNTYPGMYVPQPIGLRHVRPTQSLAVIASETLALTKMNWNQTRLDGKLPVTLRTAEQVKRVLRFCPSDRAVATRYAYYM